ncbi:head-tail connector protein [Yunchengibacter salinarum]|uniref:head-tail connector protein n=1 Tax=Yunchengibacter salinarum TaxID=3133399 RepID=UPI0035B5D444
MDIKTLSPPLNEPLLLAEVREHLRIEHDGEDGALAALIPAARDMVERRTGLILTDRSLVITLNGWSPRSSPARASYRLSGRGPVIGDVRLPVRPVSAVSRLLVTDRAGVDRTIGPDRYRLTPGLSPVLSPIGAGLPRPGVRRGGIRLTVTAGFGADWNAVPALIRQALLMVLARLYSARGDGDPCGDPIRESGAAALLAPFERRTL